jgi:hypothetical protein
MKKEMASTVMKTIAHTIKKSESSKRKRAYDADDDDESSNRQSSGQESLYNILSQSDSVMMMTVTPSPTPSKWNVGSFSCMMITGSNGDEVDDGELNEDLTHDADNVTLAEEDTQEEDSEWRYNQEYITSCLNAATMVGLEQGVTSTLIAVAQNTAFDASTAPQCSVRTIPSIPESKRRNPMSGPPEEEGDSIEARTSSSAECDSVVSDLSKDSSARAVIVKEMIAKSEFRPPSMSAARPVDSYSREKAEKKYRTEALKQKYEPK